MEKLEKLQMYVNGEWIDPASGEWFESYNPFTGKPWVLFPRGGAADAERAVEAAKKAFNQYLQPQLWVKFLPTGQIVGKIFTHVGKKKTLLSGEIAGLF